MKNILFIVLLFAFVSQAQTITNSVDLRPQASAPSVKEGRIYYDDVTKKFYGRDDSTWVDFTGAGGGADGVISNVAVNGNSLDFTGTGGGFNGSTDISTTTAVAANTAKTGLTAQQITDLGNLSGVNTGDQTIPDNTDYVDLTTTQTITGTKISDGTWVQGVDGTTEVTRNALLMVPFTGAGYHFTGANSGIISRNRNFMWQSGIADEEYIFDSSGITAERTYTLQDADGTVAFLSDVVGGTDDQTASEVPFTPYSSIAATDTQAAIQEMLDESSGTDDQTAVEVPITDAGAYYADTEVEGALQTIGAVLVDLGIESANTHTYQVLTVSTDNVVSTSDNAQPPLNADSGKKIRTEIDGNYNFIMNNAEKLNHPFALWATANVTDSVIVKGNTTAILFDIEGKTNVFGVEAFSAKAGVNWVMERTAINRYKVVGDVLGFDLVPACTAHVNEQFTTANAASDPNCNEADGVAGTAVLANTTMASIADDGTNGSNFALEGTVSGAGGAYYQFDFSVTNTTVYTLEVVVDQTVGTTGIVHTIAGSVSTTGHPSFSAIDDTPGTWETKTFTITANATGTYSLGIYTSNGGSIGDKTVTRSITFYEN